MAGTWQDETGGKTPFNTAAPAGLQQGKWQDETGGAPAWNRPAWQTGGQVGTTRNAFSEDFFTRMFDQREEEQRKIEQDKLYVSNIFARKDFTGIVTWDQTIKQDNPFIQVDRDRQFSVGDVYDNGEYIGNVYDLDSGFTQEEANGLLAPMMFGDKSADKYKTAKGDQDILERMIRSAGAEEGKNVDAFMTRLPYLQEQQGILKEWENTNWDEAAIVGGGAAAGAVSWGTAGATVGSVIPGVGTALVGAVSAAAGFIVGGVSSWLNMDESRAQSASSIAAMNMMSRDESTSAVTDFAFSTSKWAEMVNGRMNTFGNLISGISDIGHEGDDVSQISYDAAQGHVGAMIWKGVGGFADGILTGASSVNALTYAGVMGTQASSAAVMKATGGGEWDEVSGSFHRYENIQQQMAAAGSSTIDIAQSLLPAVLRGTTTFGVGGTKGADMSDLRVPGATRNVMIAERTYQLQNQGGKIVATAASKRDLIMNWIAPSSMVNYWSVRGMAQKSAMQAGRMKVTANDLYQAAARLEYASMPWKMALVNGFGESAEEVAQAYLNGVAVGHAPSQEEVVNAAIAGFAMGGGMTLGARSGSTRNVLRMKTRADSLMMQDGQLPFTQEEWASYTYEEKAMLSTPSRSAERRIRTQQSQIKDEIADLTVESGFLLEAKEAAIQEMMDKPLALPGDSFEQTFRFVPFDSVRKPSWTTWGSAKTVLSILTKNIEALAERIKQGDQSVAATMTSLQELLNNQVQPMFDAFMANPTEDSARLLNKFLKELWNGRAQGHDPAVQRQFVELVFTRNPNDQRGSQQILLPQVDYNMTMSGSDFALQGSQTLSKALGSDYDGDTIQHLARAILTDRSRTELRQGRNLWVAAKMAKAPRTSTANRADVDSNASQEQIDENTGELVEASDWRASGKVPFASRSYEDRTLNLMSAVLRSSDFAGRDTTYAAMKNLRDTLHSVLKGYVRKSTIDAFYRNMTEGHAKAAKGEFYSALGMDAANLDRLSAQGNLDVPNLPDEQRIDPMTPAIMWIEDTIQAHLSEWRNNSGLRLEGELYNAEQIGAEPAEIASGLRSTKPVEARTLGQTNDMRTASSEPIRTRAYQAYGAQNSVTIDAQGYRDSDSFRDYMRNFYTRLTRLRDGSATEAMNRQGDEVLRRVREDLRNIARESYPAEYQANPEYTMMQVANLPFWDFTQAQINSETFDLDSSTHLGFNSTIAQTLLKNHDFELQQSVPQTVENQRGSAYAKMEAATALIKLFGHVAPADILPSGLDAAHLGSFSTIASLAKAYALQASTNDRQRRRDYWQTYASYKIEGPYQFIVDMVREGVDKELAHGRHDGTNGSEQATGRLAKEDRAFHKDQVRPMFEALARLSNKLGITKDSTNQQLIDMLSNNSRALQSILSLFSPEMRVQMIMQDPTSDNPTNVILMPWFYQILRSQNAETSALIYWNALFDMERGLSEDKPAPSNSWVALWNKLDDRAKASFEDLRLSSTDLKSFVDEVNKRFAFDRVPLLMWRTDDNMYDPASTKGGWQWASASSERRQAIRDAKEYLESRSISAAAEATTRATDVMFADNLLKVLSGDRIKSDKLQTALNGLQSRINQGALFSDAAISPTGAQQFLQFAWRGWDWSAANKGNAPHAVEPIGYADIRKDQVSHGSAFDQVFDITIAQVSADNLRFNPQMLTRPLRIETRMGATIEWNPGDVKSFLELFIADDGEYSGLMYDLINPIVYDVTPDNRATPRYLFPRSLEQLTRTDFYDEIFNNKGGRQEAENHALKNAYVNSLTKNNAVLRFQAHTLLMRTTGERAGSELTGEEYSRIQKDTSKLISLLARLRKEDRQNLRLQLRNESRRKYYESLGDVYKLEATALKATPGADLNLAIDKVIETRKAVMDRAYEQAKSDPSTNQVYLEAARHYIEAVSLKSTTIANEAALQTFKIDWDNDVNAMLTRTYLVQYLNVYGPSIRSMVTGKDAELIMDYDNAPYDFNNRFKVFGNKLQNEASWDSLSKIVSMHLATQSGALRTPSNISSPELSKFVNFDPSFSYIAYDYLLSDEMLDAVSAVEDIVKEAPLDYAKISTDIQEILYRPGSVREWTPSLILQHQNIDASLDTAGSTVQITVGGTQIQKISATEIAATRTDEIVPIEAARSYSINVEDFIESKNDPYAPGLDGDPWLMLNGSAIVSNIKRKGDGGPVATITDADGNVVRTIPLSNALWNFPSLKKPKGQELYFSGTTHSGMVDAALKARAMMTDPTHTMTIDFKMLHPNDKPAEAAFANSVLFDGTIGQLDSMNSLYGALVVQNEGLGPQLQRQALDSIKGSLAVFTERMERGFDVLDPAEFKQILLDMTETVMSIRIGKDLAFSDDMYRAIYRMVRDRVKVRATVDGQPTILSSEQVLMGNTPIDNAHVFAISMQALETLNGSTSGSGYARHYEKAPTVGGDAETYQGFHTPEQLSRLPELGVVLTDIRDIGKGLQLSGLTSNERYGTYQYKEWNFANILYGNRPYAKFDTHVQNILTERVSDSERARTAEINRNMLDGSNNSLLSHLRSHSRLEEATVDLLKGDLGMVTPLRDVRDYSTVRTLSDLQNILAGQDGRIFQLDPQGKAGRSDEGFIRDLNNVPGKIQYQVAPTVDVVWFRLDNVPGDIGSPEWTTFVNDQLSYLKEHGNAVFLTHDTRYEAVAIAEEMLFKGSGHYRKDNPNLPFYRPVDDELTQQSIVAATEMFAEGTVVPLDNMVLGFATDSLPLDDEALYADPAGNLNGITFGRGQGVVPTDMLDNFTMPLTTEFGARVKSVYQYLLADPARIEYVAEQQLIGDGKDVTPDAVAVLAAEIEPLLQYALDNVDQNGFYRRGSRLELGNIYALADPNGRIALVRWGYDITDVDIAAQSSRSLDGYAFDGHPAADSLLYVGSKRVSSDVATVRGGVIENIQPDSTFGVRLNFTDEITLVGAKLVDEFGRKGSAVLIPDEYRPKMGFFRNIFPALYDSLTGREKKGASTTHVRNAQMAIYVNGWDSYRTLANALSIVDGHPDSTATRWTREEWAGLSEKKKGTIQARVYTLLEDYRLNVKDRIADTSELADNILSLTSDLTGQRKYLEEVRSKFGIPESRALPILNNSLTDETMVEMQFLSMAEMFLRGSKSRVNMLLGAPGVNQPRGENRSSYKMPSMLTEFIDSNLSIRKYIISDMNARHSNNEYVDGKLVHGWMMLDDWSMLYREPGKSDLTGQLFAARVDTTGEDHSELSAANNMASTTDHASNQRNQVARAGNRLNLGGNIRNETLTRIFERQARERKIAADGSLRQARTLIRQEQAGIPGKSREALRYEREARAIVQGAFVPIEKASYDEDATLLSEIYTNRKRLLDKLGLAPTENFYYLHDALIRSHYRAWNDPTGENSSFINARGIIEAQTQIFQALEEGNWPSAVGMLPAMHADIVNTIALHGTWMPEGVSAGPTKLRDMLEHALDTLYYSSREINAEAFRELDGLMLTYEKFLKDDGLWPSSAYPDIIKKFISEGDNSFVSSIDRVTNRQLELGSTFTTLDARKVQNSQQNLGGTQTQASRRARATRERTKHSGGAQGTTAAKAARDGRTIRDEVRFTTRAWQVLHATRTIVPQLNPYLWVWNGVDVQWRNAPNVAANFVTGQSLGWANQMVTRQLNRMADAFETVQNEAPDSRKAKIAEFFQSLAGSNRPFMSEKALELIPILKDRMLHSVEWRSMIAGSTRHRPDQEMISKFDAKLQKGVDSVAALQDSMHGIMRKFEVDAYILAILDYERLHNPEVSAEQILLDLTKDPLSYYKFAPDAGAHQQAINTISNLKGAKNSTLGIIIDRIFNPLAKSGNGILHTAGNVFFLLAKFRNFAISSAINMTGGQFVDSAASILMQGLDMKVRHAQNLREGVTETVVDYQSKVLESADLSNAFIRSGMSLTGLFTAALAANALGLTGESEEERRRRRIAELQGLGTAYNPLDIINDFRNRESIWLDGFNDTWLGALTSQYRVAGIDGEGRTPVNLHWTIGFFVNPIIGVGEFLQSGNFDDLAYRFETAFNSVPIINTNFFLDAYDTGSRLYEYAANSDAGDPTEMVDGVGFLIKTVGVFEHALLELSFVNEIVSASDEFTRAPWTEVELNDLKNITSDREGNPEKTGMTDVFLDENPESPTYGQMIERSATRTYQEGLLHSFASNNQTAALLLNLFTGQGFSGTFSRENMAIKKEHIAREALSQEDAEALILSVWDPKNNQETLTREGGERLLASLHAGTAKATDPALQGVYIPYEMRYEIADSIKRKILVEGIEVLGLTEEDAIDRLNGMWYGRGPYDIPLNDVIFNNGKFAGDQGISFDPTVTYNQLNTTWVQGPDGKYWATGVSRDAISPLLTPFNGSAAASNKTNLGFDEVLNSTDSLNQINTGIRNLTRANNNTKIPDLEDMMEADKRNTQAIIDELKDLGSDLNRNWGNYRGGYTYGGGGRGGSGGYGGGANMPYMPFLNGMRSVYLDNAPQMYINNINPRRASIRRERFSSERGRLNNQQ